MCYYRVLIYHDDEIVEDKTIRGLEQAYEYGKKRVVELGKDYWYKVKYC